MFKNQLQELAQKNSYNLPSYACIREGPDHAPRFKASVNFNGELFESPSYCCTLRLAEHAAAEVALTTLSRRGPQQLLAAKIMDETGVCKNLLQETAQRAGVSLPVYTTTRSGPGHLPVFTCRVEVAGLPFEGESAKTKKQAEKNAAMTAWNALKKWAQDASTTEANEEQEQHNIARALANVSGGEEEQRSSPPSYETPAPTTSTRPSSSSSRRSREERTTATVSSQTVPVVQLPSMSQYPWASVDRLGKEGMSGVRYLHAGVPSLVPHSARISASQIVPRAVIPMNYVSHQPSAVLSRGIPVSSSASGGPTTAYQYPADSRTVPVVLPGNALPITSSTSSRQMLVRNGDSSKVSQVAVSTPAHLEEHIRDEEEWLSGGTSSSRSSGGTSDDRSSTKEDRQGKDVVSLSRLDDHHHISQSVLFNQMGVCWDAQQLWTRIPSPYQRAAPVALRPLIRVRAHAPTEEDSNDSTEGEAATRQVLSQLSL